MIAIEKAIVAELLTQAIWLMTCMEKVLLNFEVVWYCSLETFINWNPYSLKLKTNSSTKYEYGFFSLCLPVLRKSFFLETSYIG